MVGTKSGRGDRASLVTAPLPSSCALKHRLFVRGLVLPCRIGVHRHERDVPQRVRINVELEIRDLQSPRRDAISEVVSYDDVVAGVKQMVGSDHINLVESLADRIAEFCLKDLRVERVKIMVEKLDVFGDGAIVGVEIERISGA